MYGAQQNYGGGFTQQGGAGYHPQQAQASTPAAGLSLDDVMQGGAPSAFSKNDPLGYSVEGEILDIHAEQQTDFTTGEPLYYPNGKAKPQVVIHIQTTMRDPNRVGDSGSRGIYVKGYNIAQLRVACQRAGIGDYPRVGDHLKATFASTRPSQTRGYNDAKIYEYTVTPKHESDLAAAMTTENVQSQPVQAAPQHAPAYGAPVTINAQPQPVQHAPAYGAPVTINAQPQPVQQGLPASDMQTIGQLAAAGKQPAEIAGLINRPVEQVVNALGAANGREPEF